MEDIIKTKKTSKSAIWTGYVLTYIAVLFMLFDSITKIMKTDQVVKATAQLGFPVEDIPVIGIILLVCIIIYVIPKTSILGAILLTGYLGGAVVTNLRISAPLFSNVLFPVYMGIIVWGGIFLRDELLRKIIPFRAAE